MPTAIINGKTVVIPKGHEVIEIDGEKKVVTAGEAKKLLKALKEVAKAAPAAAGGGGGGGGAAAPAVVLPKRDLRSNAEKVQDANLAEVDAAAAKNPEPGLWKHHRHDLDFYRVEEIDGTTAKVSRFNYRIIKREKLAAFLVEHPDAQEVEPEYVRVRKINPRPMFQTTAVMANEVEVRWTEVGEVGITKGLLKEDGKRVSLRELKDGAIVAVRTEVADIRKTVLVRTTDGGFYRDQIVSESYPRIFAVVPEDRAAKYELAHELAL